MAKKSNADTSPAVVQAVTSFAWQGRVIRTGDTVEVGHPMLRGHMSLFRPLRPTWPKASASWARVTAPPAPTAESPEPEPEVDATPPPEGGA